MLSSTVCALVLLCRISTLFVLGQALSKLKILAISGSTRVASCNTGLLRACANYLPTDNVSFEIYIPKDLPLFNFDIETSDQVPQSVIEFRKKVRAADGLLFSVPEHNYGMSAALKNAIDWASTPKDGNCFNDKPAVAIGSGGDMGGFRAMRHFRDCAHYLNLHLMNHPQLQARLFEQPSPCDFNTGEVIDPKTFERAQKLSEAMVVWFNKFRK